MTRSTAQSLRPRSPAPPGPDQVEPEVEHRGRVGQRADRDPVRPGGGVGADGGQRHAAGHLGEDRARTRPGGPPRSPRPPVPGSMLSSSTASAPARAASATWSSVSHSISTIRPGHSARARRTASAMLVPARWLSLTSTASDRPARWLVPAAGPHGRLLERAQARRRLAGVEHRHRRVALVRRRDELRGERGHARQAPEEVQRRALGGEDRPQRPGHLQHRVARRPARRRRSASQRQLELGADARGTSRWRSRRPASTPARRARSANCAVHVLGHQRRRQVAARARGPRPGRGSTASRTARA